MSKMRAYRWLKLVGFFLIAGLMAGCGLKETKVVARVGNSLITLGQFEEAFLKEKPVYVAKKATLEEKKRFLQKMMDKKLQILAAYQMGIDKDPRIQERIEGERSRIAYFATMDKNVVYKVIKEEEIRDFYDKSRVEVRARHILIRVSPDAKEKDVEDARQKALKVIEQLKSGKDFAELVKEYSEDRATVSRGGDLGFIRWGRMEQPILDAVFKMGRYEITPEPVRTSRGFHILQVTDRRILPQKPYKLERDNIVRVLFRKKRGEIMKVYEEFNKELNRKHHVRIIDANLDTVAVYLSQPKVDSLFRAIRSMADLSLEWMDPGIKNLPLASVDHKPFTIVNVLHGIVLRSGGAPLMPIRGTKMLKEVVQNEINIALAIQYGKRKGYLRQSPYREEVRNKIEEILTTVIRKREIQDKINITEEQKKQYYEQHPEKYRMPAKADVQEVYVQDVALANKIANWAKAGRSFDRLAEKYNTRVTTRNKKGHLGWLTANSYGVIGRNALEMKVGEIRGPIKVGDHFSIIKVLAREEEHLRPYDEVKTAVEADLRRELIKQREEEWKKGLQKVFPMRMFTDVLNQAFKDLT